MNDTGTQESARQTAEEALAGRGDLLVACRELAAMRGRLCCLPDGALDTLTDGARDGTSIRLIQQHNGDFITGFLTNLPRSPG